MEEAGAESAQEDPARERVHSAREPQGTQRRNAEMKAEPAPWVSLSLWSRVGKDYHLPTRHMGWRTGHRLECQCRQQTLCSSRNPHHLRSMLLGQAWPSPLQAEWDRHSLDHQGMGFATHSSGMSTHRLASPPEPSHLP